MGKTENVSSANIFKISIIKMWMKDSALGLEWCVKLGKALSRAIDGSTRRRSGEATYKGQLSYRGAPRRERKSMVIIAQ